jgi:glutathione synthase/RimK-type ligase-like ATP-grasp enzyme
MTTDECCVGLVTSAAAIGLDPDHDVLVEALGRHAAKAVPVIWDDPEVNWDELDAAVIRSTWDYHTRYSEFLGWVDRVTPVTTLHNPAPVVRWSTDKSYLAELSAAGLPVVPTTYLRPGRPLDLDLDTVAVTGDVVIKPAVSAGSIDTARYSPAEHTAALDHAHRLLDQGRAVLVQPYQDAVDRDGETALVYIEGTLSHGFRKGPILLDPADPSEDALFVEEEVSARAPTPEQAAVGNEVVRAIEDRFGRLLYARVDLLPTPTGPIVLEVELVEPSLYHEFGPGSADRFAAAIVARTRLSS